MCLLQRDLLKMKGCLVRNSNFTPTMQQQSSVSHSLVFLQVQQGAELTFWKERGSMRPYTKFHWESASGVNGNLQLISHIPNKAMWLNTPRGSLGWFWKGFVGSWTPTWALCYISTGRLLFFLKVNLDPESYLLHLTCPGYKWKSIIGIRARKTATWTRKKNISQTNTKMNQILKWFGKDFKSAITNTLY